MKMNIIVVLLLICNFAYIFFKEPYDDEKIQSLIDVSLKQREKELVLELAPTLLTMVEDSPSFEKEGWRPETLEELVLPLSEILSEIFAEDDYLLEDISDSLDKLGDPASDQEPVRKR